MADDDLKDIRELLQELITKQALHALEQNSIKEDVGQIKHVLIDGNGTPALTIQVATMNERVKQLEESERDKKVPRHVSIGIWVSIVLAVGGILAGFSAH